MSNKPVPAAHSRGIRLHPARLKGIQHVEVTDAQERFSLPWDRFMRLKVAGDHLRRIVGEDRKITILDVGGFDGAFAMFVPGHQVDLLDIATTGGTGLQIDVPDRSYGAVVAIDVIEHVVPHERAELIAELARVTGELCLINVPNQATKPAQELVLALTGNSLVKEHVELGLPAKSWIQDEIVRQGLTCQVIPGANLGIWVAQYTLQNLLPEVGASVSRYLVEAHNEEPFSVPLYFLFICARE